jgi:UDP-2,4-diacetamido-2,4,6-trideoxy-beta-L-altropyranose hydrolase
MRVAFRADASIQIGTGHVMRCLSLADALRNRGVQCRFICRTHQGHLRDYIAQNGHEIIELSLTEVGFNTPAYPAHAAWLGADWTTDAEQTGQVLGLQPADWLVVDHYALDRRWEQALKPHCQRIMVIDDLADRHHDCDLLLDQNLGRVAQDYCSLLNAETELLIGPKYALLRPEFTQWRALSLKRRCAQPKLRNLLITMGGVDKDNATGKVLEALKGCALHHDVTITVIMGTYGPWIDTIKLQAAQLPWPTRVLSGVSNMAQLMTQSDLAIGAAGSTSWERCCLGLPTIQVVLAENQKTIATSLDSVGAAVVVDVDDLFHVLPQLLIEIVEGTGLQSMSSVARDVTDGSGSDIVADLLLKDFNENYVSVQ